MQRAELCKESSKYAHPWSPVHITIAQTPEPRPSTPGTPPRTIISAGRQAGVGGEMGSIWAPRETRAAGRHALSRRARGVQPASTSIFAERLVTRQARGSPAAPVQPCFGSARPGTSTTTRTRECRRSSAAVGRSARSFYSILLSAAHDKAQSHAAPLRALTSRLRGSTGAVLQRAVRASGLTPDISQEPPTQRPLAAPAPPQRTLSAQTTRSRARSVALGAGFGRHGVGSRAHEPGSSRAMKTCD